MTPDEILREFGIEQPSEIDIEAIAHHFGATVVYERLDGCEARVIGVGDRAFISVNPHPNNRGRERFSAAHELGHWLRDRAHVTCTEKAIAKGWSSGREMRANRFAQGLLMPVAMFQTRARGHGATLSAVRELAGDFQASMTATAIRLVEHGAVPAALACYTAEGTAWIRKGPLVPESLWVRATPTPSSITGRLLRGDTGVPESCNWSADEWIDHKDAHEHEIHEEAFVSATGTVVTLLWWQDESQILALDDE